MKGKGERREDLAICRPNENDEGEIWIDFEAQGFECNSMNKKKVRSARKHHAVVHDVTKEKGKNLRGISGIAVGTYPLKEKT